MVILKRYFIITIGAIIMGVAVKMFFDTAGLVTGGFSGIAIILESLIHLPIWITNFLLNIPLFIIGMKMLKREEFISSLYTSFIFTFALGVLPEYNPVGTDIFLSAITGGFIMGVGMGIILLNNTTSGGVDMVAHILHEKNKGTKTVWLIFMIDAAIIAAGTGVFGFVSTIYAVMAVFIVSFISGKIVDGPMLSKAAYIITDKSKEISERIMENLKRGVSTTKVEGMFTKSTKNMLICIVKKREIGSLIKIVEKEDQNAFLWIVSANEVFGEGFVKNNY